MTLEVIALDAVDAERAQEGGADRLELVSDMARGGLTPELRVVREVVAATDLPVRVMLRDAAGFASPGLEKLRRRAHELLDAGAREFVFGFLTENGEVDVDATVALAAELDGARWTFHRAVDHAADVRVAHEVVRTFSCDSVLSAGSPDGTTAGMPVLRELATRPELLVGGGLRAEQVAPLSEAGVRSFHIGSAARPGGWHEPVDVDSVRNWATLIAASPTLQARESHTPAP